MNGTDFCSVIDEISVFFLGELKKLSPENREAFRNKWGNTLKAVYECCLDISVCRNAVDWCFDNDLMAISSRQGYKDWKDHLMVLISFSALMAVADMFLKTAEYLERRNDFALKLCDKPNILLYLFTFSLHV